MTLRKLGLCCGIVAPVLWVALIAAAGSLRPDFSHVTHYISELGERGSSTEVLMRYWAFGFTGLLYICFAGTLLATVHGGGLWSAAAVLIVLDGIGRIGAGVFPCDPGCVQVSSGVDLHKLFATIGFSAGTLAAFLWGALFRRLPPLRRLSSFSAGCGVVALVSLLLLSFARDPVLPRGLLEHLATLVLSVWLLVFAGRLAWIENTGMTKTHHVLTPLVMLIAVGSYGVAASQGTATRQLDIIDAPLELPPAADGFRSVMGKPFKVDTMCTKAKPGTTMLEVLGPDARTLMVHHFDRPAWADITIVENYIGRLLTAVPEGGRFAIGVYWAEGAFAEITGSVEFASGRQGRVELGNGYAHFEDESGCEYWARYLGGERSKWVVRQ